MAKYKVNEKCIIGIPSCGYGFESSRMCFIGRPADGEFQLEEDILTQVLKERNYEKYVALQKIDPGNFAFCTKICSKIITSHFCIVLLNRSEFADDPKMKIPNPNVHMEYGMMLGLYKHVIPMQRENESLPFNIYPFDTIKYKPENFKTKSEEAIDDAILRFSTNEPPGRPIGAASNVLKYFSFKGLRYTDITDATARAVFALGQTLGFNLFDGEEGIVYFGYFHEEDPREIVVLVRSLINNINLSHKRLDKDQDKEQRDTAKRILDQLSIEVMVPETANVEAMQSKIKEYQDSILNVPVTLHKPSYIELSVKSEYEGIVL